MEKLKTIYLQFRRRRTLFFIAFMGSTLAGLILVDLLQEMIDTAIRADIGRFRGFGIKFLWILGGYLAAVIADQYLLRSLIYYGETALKRHTFVSFLKNFHSGSGQELGERVSAINNDISVISFWLSKGKISIVGQSVILLIYLVMMAGYNLVITGITVVMILGVFWLSQKFEEKEAYFTGKQQALYGKINAYLYNWLQNFPVICQMHNECYFCRRLKRLHELGEKEILHKLSRFSALNDAMLNFMTNTLPLFAFALGLLFTKTGQMTTGETIAIMLVSQKLNEPIILLAALILDKKNASRVYERISDIYESSALCDGERDVASFEGMQVRINAYQYQCAKESILHHVILDVAKGDTVLIKVASGCGKSTLLKLMCRLEDFQGLDGSIQYNHYPVEEYKTKQYYNYILYVEQNTVLVEGSLYENLLFGECYAQSEIDEVLWTCVLDTFCDERGFDFYIKENGENISGGERQRIGIARMLLRKPEVLVLDEATSALDEESRRILLDRLMIYKQKFCMTILAISHMGDFDEYCNQVLTVGRTATVKN